jgi:predicted secreted protein
MIIDFLTGFAVFFIIWWLVLFTVLPWGMRSAHESGDEVKPGNDRAAPAQVNILRKFAVTTLVSLVAYGFYYWLMYYSDLTLLDLPFLPRIPDMSN